MTDTPQPHPPPGEPQQNPAVRHEQTDADLRGVLAFAGVLAASIAVVLGVLVAMFFAFKGREDRDKQSRFPLSERHELPQTTFGARATGSLPEEPRLEGLNLARPQQEEPKNPGKPGAVHISIEQAMRLVAEESKPKGHEPAPVRYDAGIPGTGGGSNSGRDLPEAKR